MSPCDLINGMDVQTSKTSNITKLSNTIFVKYEWSNKCSSKSMTVITHDWKINRAKLIEDGVGVKQVSHNLKTAMRLNGYDV